MIGRDELRLADGECTVDGCDEPAAPGRANFHGKCRSHQRQLSQMVAARHRGSEDARDVDVRTLTDLAAEVTAASKRLDRALRMRRAVHHDIEAAAGELASSMRELRDTAQAAIRTSPA